MNEKADLTSFDISEHLLWTKHKDGTRDTMMDTLFMCRNQLK